MHRNKKKIKKFNKNYEKCKKPERHIYLKTKFLNLITSCFYLSFLVVLKDY